MASGGEKRTVSRGNMSFLLREAEVWRELGLISAEQAGGICGLYSARRGRLQNALLGLGGVLVGLGVLSFVAANWLDMSRLLRALLILAGYTAALVASWGCRERFPRTSRAFLLIGSFIYGGGIFLMAQMFHQGGEWRSAVGWWIAGLIPTVGLFRDRWQAVLLQGLTALYLLFNPLFHPGRVWNVVTWGSTPLWDCLEPFLRNPDELLILAALWGLGRLCGGRTVFRLNALLSLLLLGERFQEGFDDEIALLALALVGLALSLLAPRREDRPLRSDLADLGLLTAGAFGLLLTWPDLWAWTGQAQFAAVLALVDAAVVAVLMLLHLGRRRGISVFFLLLLIARYFFDDFLRFTSKAWAFSIAGAGLLALGFLLERRLRHGEEDPEEKGGDDRA